MNNLIRIDPMSRINDRFITSRNLVKLEPINSDVTHPLVNSGVSFDTQFAAEFYKSIALDIVTETALDYPYPYVTEKTLRPIAAKRMFIVLGPKGIIKLLRSHGFQTFEDIIDESYDGIEDPELRFLAVVREIEKFCSRSIESIREFYANNVRRFEHNARTLNDLRDAELRRISNQLGRKK